MAQVQTGQAGDLLSPLGRQRRVSGAHVGKQRAAFFGRDLLRVQDGEQRQVVFVSRVGVPIGGAFDAVPIDFSVLIHVGEPGDVGMLGVAIFHQRVLAGFAEMATKGGEFPCAEVLLPEHQHGMLGEGARDPGERRVVERARQVDAQSFSPQCLSKRAQSRCVGHGPSSPVGLRSDEL